MFTIYIIVYSEKINDLKSICTDIKGTRLLVYIVRIKIATQGSRKKKVFI